MAKKGKPKSVEVLLWAPEPPELAGCADCQERFARLTAGRQVLTAESGAPPVKAAKADEMMVFLVGVAPSEEAWPGVKRILATELDGAAPLFPKGHGVWKEAVRTGPFFDRASGLSYSHVTYGRKADVAKRRMWFERTKREEWPHITFAA